MAYNSHRETPRGVPASRRDSARQGQPCQAQGYRFVSFNLAEGPTRQVIHEGPCYGYQVVSGGSASAFIQTGKIRASQAGPEERAAGTGEGLVGHADPDGRAPFDSVTLRVPASLTGTIVVLVILYPTSALPLQRSLLTGGASGLAADVRNADADDDGAAALNGLVSNARAYYLNSSSSDWARWTGSAFSSVHGGSQTGAMPRVAAGVFGRDSSDSTLRVIEGRNADADADYAAALYAMLVNARNATYNTVAGDWARWAGGAPSQITGKAHNSNDVVGGNVNAMLFARETVSATPTMVAVEARLGSAGHFGSALYGILANSRLGAFDGTDYGRLLSRREISGTEGGGLGTMAIRPNHYWAGLGDRRFVMALPAATYCTIRNGYLATEPQLLFVAPATNEWVISRIEFSANANLDYTRKIRIVADPDNRYSAATAPTSFIPTGGFKSTNRGGSGTLTPTRAVYYDGATVITATAEDNDELHYGDYSPFSSVTNTWTWLPPDGELIIPPSGSLLIYIFDAGGGGTMSVTVYLESANIQ